MRTRTPRWIIAPLFVAAALGCNNGEVLQTETVFALDEASDAEIVLTAIRGYTGEDGREATFDVSLSDKPSAKVVVEIRSDDETEGIVSKSSLTFTGKNWASVQTVTVSGVDDDIVDGNVEYLIRLPEVVSDDDRYSDLSVDPLVTSNVDDDQPRIVTSVISRNTSEIGTTATFSVVLSSEPTDDVLVTLESSAIAEGTIDKGSLKFDAINWQAPQVVTVTGVDDEVADGNAEYTIDFSPAASKDTHYSTIVAPSVMVTNLDDEQASIIVSQVSGNTNEAGGQATVSIVLASEPQADVSLSVSTSDSGEGSVDQSTIRFTKDNWKAPQLLTVTGVDDAVADGDQSYQLLFSAAISSDANYAALAAATIDLLNVDNETAGVVVSAPLTGTSESGTQTSFSVVLSSEPTADVTVSFASSDVTEGKLDRGSLTFTAVNWQSPQVVVLNGVDDDLQDGNTAYEVVFAPTASVDLAYAAITPAGFQLLNVDNDTAGIVVAAPSVSTTDESGAQTAFALFLAAQPSENVTIALVSSDLSEGTAVPASVTFTSTNWLSPQVVSVTGVEDEVADGDVPYAVVFSPAVSLDPNYSQILTPSIGLSNLDNDSAGFSIGPVTGSPSESGGQAAFRMNLRSLPAADVVLALQTSDASEALVTPATLTFTAANALSPQTVIVSGVDDEIADGNVPFSIAFGPAVSTDTTYSGLVASNVPMVNVDNDSPGFIATVVTGQLSESGGQATYALSLASQPLSDVSVTLTSSDLGEAIVAPGVLTFTPDNYAAPQSVIISGVNDTVADGNASVGISYGATSSTDSAYAALSPPNLVLSNLDNDSAGVLVTPLLGSTTEDEGQATFTIALTSEPTANVTLNFLSSDETEAVLDTNSLTFTPANAQAPQTVTITGVNDDLVDGSVEYTVVFSASSSTDVRYAAIQPATITAVNTDNDSAGITISALTGATSESGGTASFTVVLNSEPTDTVTLGLVSSAESEGTVDRNSLSLTVANWFTPQAVVITGVDDSLADGNVAYAVEVAPAVSADPNYTGLQPANIAVTNIDNDSAAIEVSVVDGATDESGAEATFSVVLTSQPGSSVQIGLSTSDATEGATDVASLVFTQANWDTAQAVVVTGVNDDVSDGDQPYSIEFQASTSGDAAYNGLASAAVALVNADDDVPAFIVSAISGSVTEAGSKSTFTIVLNTEPTHDVTVNFDSSDLTEGDVDVDSLTFTAANWDVEQSVSVTGLDDAEPDADVQFVIAFEATASLDASYAAIVPADVVVVNLDDEPNLVIDTTGTNFSPIERGGLTTFSVALAAPPRNDVAISVASSDSDQATASGSELTFTANNWDIPQVVTVTAVDNVSTDANPAYDVLVGETITGSEGSGTHGAAVISLVTFTNTNDD